MATIYIHDVRIEERPLEIPEKCPGCDADLTQEQAMKLTQLCERVASASIIGGSDIVWVDTPDNCDYIGTMKAACVRCGATLVAGTYEVQDDDK